MPLLLLYTSHELPSFGAVGVILVLSCAFRAPEKAPNIPQKVAAVLGDWVPGSKKSQQDQRNQLFA